MFPSEKQGVVDVITGDGPLNSENVERLAEALQACLDGGQPMAVLDMVQIPHVDSQGLELLLDYQDEFIKVGGRVILANVNQLCRDILVATGVGDRFEFFNNRTDAVGSFSK